MEFNELKNVFPANIENQEMPVCNDYKPIGTGDCWTCGRHFYEHQKRIKTMKTEHTPGPWETFGPGNPQIYGGDPKRRICVLDHLTGADMSENYANARLIAAAPEMLEALKFAETEVAFIERTHNVVIVLNKIRTAIKKAEGL